MRSQRDARALIVMGVSGAGKSSVGSALSNQLGWSFYDADDFHPAANVAKMAGGIPLTDEDRRPWLEALRKLIQDQLAAEQSLVLACSALKEIYRVVLNNDSVTFIYLQGSYDLILQRLQARAGHYMKADLLKSQFDTLEEPANALYVSIDTDVSVLSTRIMRQLGLARAYP